MRCCVESLLILWQCLETNLQLGVIPISALLCWKSVNSMGHCHINFYFWKKKPKLMGPASLAKDAGPIILYTSFHSTSWKVKRWKKICMHPFILHGFRDAGPIILYTSFHSTSWKVKRWKKICMHPFILHGFPVLAIVLYL
jgi:hypothetical protein